MADPLLDVQRLGVAYGDVRAVWDVSFTVGAGEIVVLIGPNGAGKTTLMRTLAGLHRPVDGEVWFDGRLVHGPSLHTPAHTLVEQGILLVHEGRRLFGGMSVLENLEMGAFPPAARTRQAETLRRVFDLFPRLAERKHQRAATLSGGEQQMLAIGRAMMGLPRLLLLDEPSLGLAPLIVNDIFDVIRLLNRPGDGPGMSVLLVEQNAKRALALANRAYIIEQGRVGGSGTGDALLQDPRVQHSYLGSL